MLDIELFRTKSKIIKDSEKKRGKDPKVVDNIIKLDNQWRTSTQKLQKLQQKRNSVSLEINQLKKQKKSATSKIKEMRKVASDIKKLEEKTTKLLEIRDKERYKVGNILHLKVPEGPEDKFKTVRKRGKLPKIKKPKHHADLILDLDLADLNKASETSGARFYYLKNQAVILNFALLRLALDVVMKHGFTPLWTPFMINYKHMRAAAELSDFEETLFKIENEDLYLIPSSEQSIAAFASNKVFSQKDLPQKFTAYSSCFRKEAGSHGKDTKGIFRVHQFDKIEQFIICEPKDSWNWFEKLIKIQEEIFQKLEIPYRVIDVPSEDINDNASRKYDLEGWFPAQKKYRELGSCSNLLDYQARKTKTKFGAVGSKKELAHTLNCTAIPTQRTICAFLENHQQTDGSIKIPKALWKYTGFKVIKPKRK